MRWLLFVVLLSVSANLFASEIVGAGKHKPRFVFIPYGSKNIRMLMQDDDTVGSVIRCMDKVHRRGGGTCQIAAHSLKVGKTDYLYRKYNNVIVTVK